jgi:hypothetical protein
LIGRGITDYYWNNKRRFKSREIGLLGGYLADDNGCHPNASDREKAKK